MSPALASIPVLGAAPKTRPAPKPVPQPVEPPPPPVPTGPPPAPTLPIATAAPAPATPPQPAGGTALSEAEFAPYPSRWDILDRLPYDPRVVRGRPLDPYNQNVLKGDKPIAGDSLFLVLTGTLEVPGEGRRLPVPSGVSTAGPGSVEFFGQGDQLFATPRAIVSAELFDGQTAFKPKTWALKATGVFDLNYLKVKERNLVTADVRDLLTRRREDAALEEAFGEVKLATLSRNYDFVSARVGIQPFVSDFRGLVFSDSNLGARLFGNASNNRWQYNAAYFDLLEKDTNSDLNTFEKREQKVAIAQRLPPGLPDAGLHGVGQLPLQQGRAELPLRQERHPDAAGARRPSRAPRGGVQVRGPGRGRPRGPVEPLQRVLLRVRPRRAERGDREGRGHPGVAGRRGGVGRPGLAALPGLGLLGVRGRRYPRRRSSGLRQHLRQPQLRRAARSASGTGRPSP